MGLAAFPPEESLVPAKNGSPTVLVNGQALHSRYDPAGEAEKYLSSLSLENNFTSFILIEPGLGYLVPALRKRFPLAKIAALHVSVFFEKTTALRFEQKPGLFVSWSPESPVDLDDFLETEFPGADTGETKIIEWRPALGAYGKPCLDIFSRTVEYLKRSSAARRTLRGFGRKWFRNALRNLKPARRLAVPARAAGFPVYVTASGPGLEEALPLLAQCRSSVLAAASSVPCLLNAGIRPDMVISTDGGAWALVHLYETCRAAGTAGQSRWEPIIAAGLCAALPSQLEQAPLLFISDGSFWQRCLLTGLGIPHITLPPRGTVSASALDLAFGISSGPVYIAGLDLCHRDLRTHARPYAFDRLADEASSRLKPQYSAAFTRESEVRAGGSYDIYASWFKTQIPSYPARLYSLSGDPSSLGIPVTGFSRRNGGRPGFVFRETPGTDNAAAILSRALKDPASSGPLAVELSQLLFPEEKTQVTITTPIDTLAGTLIEELARYSHG